MIDEQQISLEFAPDRSTAGFRLHTCSVYNWGTFHGRIHHFTPAGRTSLLTGSNGSGKSTLADALLTLLIDSRKRNYNQASGGDPEKRRRKERTERDYILGTYSEKHDEDLGYRRPQQLRKAGQAVTVLLAVFHNETFQSHVSLGQVLWVNTAGKVERAFIVARKRLTIEADFGDLGSPGEVRQRLRDRALEPLDNFAAYSQRFHEALCLSPDRAPMDIFNQAICIKDISDLTSFIRRYMLDDGGAARKLEDLRANFEELRLTHERIQREKVRLDKLEVIRVQHERVRAQDTEVAKWQACLDALPLYFAEKEGQLREAEAERLQTALVRARAEKASADLQEGQAGERIQQLERERDASKEGRRLREIEKEIARLSKRIEEIKPRSERFSKSLEDWRKGPAPASEAEFTEIVSEAAKALPELEEKIAATEESMRKLDADLRANLDEQECLSAEIRSLLERQSNIGDDAIQRRKRLATVLKVPVKELPFVGELLQVREAEARWTGAIERLLHNFGLSVLVPAKHRRAADAFVHGNHQHGLLVYHIVEPGTGDPEPVPAPGSVMEKLEIHPEAGYFRSWLLKELSRRADHFCCEEPDEAFHAARTAITLNGLIRQRGSERRKDDRSDLNDASHFVLGWDNTSKIRALETKQKDLRRAESEWKGQLNHLRDQRAAFTRSLKGAASLPDIASRWEEIDYATPSADVMRLRAESEALRKASNRLEEIRRQLDGARKEQKAAKERADAAQSQIALRGQEASENTKALELCQSILHAAEADAEKGEKLRSAFSAVRDLIGLPVSSLASLKEARSQTMEEAREKRSNAFRARDGAIQQVKLGMQRFLDQVKQDEPRLHDELYSEDLGVSGYNESLYAPFEKVRRRIVEEDLPKNESRFKRLLQNNLIEDVSGFDGLLTDHAESIKRRIRELNEHLREVDFDRMRGTYIQLIPTATADEHQRWFRSLRRYALEESTRVETTDEQRQESFQRMRHFLDELAADERRTQKVIDVRNWFEFRADEYRREDNAYKQSHSGASGKSGGEKNRLASTILATAIAFQYGISLGNERQSETFRLVVVDEMFSKTDDEFSTYLLELFKQFHLQLIIIQPLDSKIHLVQKYVERYHVVTRKEEFSEIHNLTVGEYKRMRKPAEVP